MNTSTDFDATDTRPAALPAGLQSRLLGAMQQAADEERECREVEQLLRRMQPAALPTRLAGQLGVRMYVESQRRKGGFRSYHGWCVGVAAAVLLCATALSLLLPGAAVAGDDRGLVSRHVIDSRSTGKVEWRRGEAPVRHYQVIYEDSFVLDAEETTTIIRVPHSTEVEVEEEYL